MEKHLDSKECPFIKSPTIDDILNADKWARLQIGGI